MKQMIAGYHVLEIINETRGAVYFECTKGNEPERYVLKKLKSKRPSPSDMARFKQVYDKIRSLTTDGIVRTRDILYQDDTIYLVQEHVPAVPVTEILSKEGPFGIRVFIDVAIQLSKTLADLHGQRIAHWGVRPHHILIDKATGRVKLNSFGIETVITRENETLFNPEVVARYLPYQSPEQTGRMNLQVDERADMYCLGASFYHMLTGKPPFVSEDPLDVMYAHLAREPVSPKTVRPGIPRTLSHMILKLLSKNAGDRYQNALGLMSDLEACERFLDDTGTIPDMELGENDYSRRLYLPQTLYGRQHALDRLNEAFNRVNPESARNDDRDGDIEVLLVTGKAGVGKSVLIQEIQKPVTARRGYFITGKFQQFKRDTPYSALIQAFQHLVRQILQESDERVRAWKTSILDAVGTNGKIITDLIPDVELIIGPQPDVIHMGPKETMVRAMDIIERFMGVFAQTDHPLSLFIDDLQWADRASLQLFETVIRRKNLRHLFFIGSYRDDEVDDLHPLAKTLNRADFYGAVKTTIHLENLSVADVEDMARDIFGCSLEQARPFSALVHEKTLGNPFFVGEFFQALHNQNLIQPGPRGGWTWDMEGIQKFSVTDNVVSLMTEKINQLPDMVRETLKICACAGQRFDLELVAMVRDTPLNGVLSMLSEAEDGGLIRREGDDYTFIHDRIHEAAYSLIPAEERQAIHHRIGKLLFDSSDEETLKNRIFEVTDHLNLGGALVAEPKDRMLLSYLNLTCSQRAKAAMAYGPAAGYLDKGMALLSPDCWARQYNLTYQLHKESVEVETFLGHVEKVDRLTESALPMCRSLPDKAIIYQIKIAACIAREDIQGALEAGFHFSALADNHATGSPEEIAERYEKTIRAFEGKSDEDILALPQMTHPLHIAVMQVGSDLGYALYSMAPGILESGTMNAVCTALEHGISPHHPAAFCSFGLTLISRYYDIDQGYRFGRLGMKMAEKPFCRLNKCRAIYLFNTQIRHWKEHLKHTLEPYLEGYRLGIETGDHLYAADSLGMYDGHMVRITGNLIEAEQTVIEHTRMIKQLNQKQIYSKNLIFLQIIRNLIGKAVDPLTLSGSALAADKDVPQWEASGNRLLLAVYWAVQAWLYVYLDRIEDGARAIKNISEYKDAVSASAIIRDEPLLDALLRTRLYEKAGDGEQSDHRTVIESHLKALKTWSGHCEENTLHLYHLAKGEYCRVLGDAHDARAHLEQALSLSKKYGFLLHEMVAADHLFKFHLNRDNLTLARTYLTETVICANTLGAVAKIRQLKDDHRALFDEMDGQAAGTGQPVRNPVRSH